MLIGSFTYNISNFCFSLGNIKGNSMITILKSIIYLSFVFVFGTFFGIYGILSAALFSIIFSEAIYYPKKIVSLLEVSKKDILPLIKENFLLITVGIIMSSAFHFFAVEIEDWIDLIVYASIFTLLFWGIFILISTRLRIFLKDLVLKLKHSKLESKL